MENVELARAEMATGDADINFEDDLEGDAELEELAEDKNSWLVLSLLSGITNNATFPENDHNFARILRNRVFYYRLNQAKEDPVNLSNHYQIRYLERETESYWKRKDVIEQLRMIARVLTCKPKVLDLWQLKTS